MTAKDTQIGGEHYKKMAIQPADYIIRNGIGWAEGCAIAYLSRWQDKGGIEDLKKAVHTIQLLIESKEGRAMSAISDNPEMSAVNDFLASDQSY